jgi:hypothetical protein
MKTKPALILFLTTLALSLSAADSTNRLRFPIAGFSIVPLETPPGNTGCQAIMMFLPATASFAPNVNVQIQPYLGTIEEYTKLTLKQFEDAGIKLIEQRKEGKSVVFFEYSGKLQGRSLHWYARAEKVADHVYLATATATQEDWPKESAALRTCVDSLRCESGGAAAEPTPSRR